MHSVPANGKLTFKYHSVLSISISGSIFLLVQNELMFTKSSPTCPRLPVTAQNISESRLTGLYPSHIYRKHHICLQRQYPLQMLVEIFIMHYRVPWSFLFNKCCISQMGEEWKFNFFFFIIIIMSLQWSVLWLFLTHQLLFFGTNTRTAGVKFITCSEDAGKFQSFCFHGCRKILPNPVY